MAGGVHLHEVSRLYCELPQWESFPKKGRVGPSGVQGTKARQRPLWAGMVRALQKDFCVVPFYIFCVTLNKWSTCSL